MQGDDDLGQVHDKLQATKAVMSDSIEKVLERGEKIELLVDKTEHLHQHAFRFAKSSTQLKRSLRWREMKCKIIAAAVTLCVLALVGTHPPPPRTRTRTRTLSPKPVHPNPNPNQVGMLACGGPTFDTCRTPAK